MTTVQNEWLTIAEACDYLRVARATVYRWARAGNLPLFKLGGRATRVKRADLDRMLVEKASDNTWTRLSETSFAGDWDNEKDAAYDNWRELYGVRKG